jgi:hypothetical protein
MRFFALVLLDRMVKHNKKNRAASATRRRAAKRGGGWGFTGAASIPGQVNNPMVYTGVGDCRAAAPGYQIPYGDYGKYTGLPGMAGGKRRSRRRANRRQNGGRYGFDLANPVPGAAAPWAGGIPPVVRIACEGSTPNPLNNGPHTPSTQPLPVESANKWMGMTGGGPGSTHFGVGNVDSMYYYAPTAGYDNKPSSWVDSVGAPVQLQVPFAAHAMNQACLTTGGSPPLTGALMRGGGLTNAASAAAHTVGTVTGDFVGATRNLVSGTAGAAVGSAGQLLQAGSDMGRTIASGVGMRGGGPLEVVTDGVGRVVSGSTGLMGTAAQGVAGATGTLLSGTTGALGSAASGVARGTEHTITGLVDTGRALLKGGKRNASRKSRKNRKASRKNRKNRKASRKH